MKMAAFWYILSCSLSEVGRLSSSLLIIILYIIIISLSGPTLVGTGNGDPEVPELPSFPGDTAGQLCLQGYKYGGLVVQVESWREADNLTL
jgi:hypothetical protein